MDMFQQMLIVAAIVAVALCVPTLIDKASAYFDERRAEKAH